MGADFKLVARRFVDVRERSTSKRSIRVGSGTGPRTIALERYGGLTDRRRLIDQILVESLKDEYGIFWFCTVESIKPVT